MRVYERCPLAPRGDKRAAVFSETTNLLLVFGGRCRYTPPVEDTAMLRECYCPKCHKPAGLQFDDGTKLKLPRCETCGSRIRFVSKWTDNQSRSLARGAGVAPSARECQEAEVAQSPLTYRQRCSKGRTDSG